MLSKLIALYASSAITDGVDARLNWGPCPSGEDNVERVKDWDRAKFVDAGKWNVLYRDWMEHAYSNQQCQTAEYQLTDDGMEIKREGDFKWNWGYPWYDILFEWMDPWKEISETDTTNYLFNYWTIFHTWFY